MTAKPIGARVMAQWNSDGYPTAPFPAYISLTYYDEQRGTDGAGVNDDSILYYVADESELRSLMEPTTNPDDFVVLEYELVYE